MRENLPEKQLFRGVMDFFPPFSILIFSHCLVVSADLIGYWPISLQRGRILTMCASIIFPCLIYVQFATTLHHPRKRVFGTLSELVGVILNDFKLHLP